MADMTLRGQMWKRWEFACDPDESSKRSCRWALAWWSVQPNPETKSYSSPLCFDVWQQLMDHTCCLKVMHRCQGATSLPAAPPSLSEGSLLEEDSIASLLMADSITLCQITDCWRLPRVRLPQLLALVSRGQTNCHQPQDTEKTHAAATAAAPDSLHPPPRYRV